MIVKLRNLEQYILCMISLCGQLPSNSLGMLGLKKNYLQKKLRELVSQKELLCRKTPYGRMYRLKKPKGYNFVKDIDGLADHYNLITNDHLFFASDVAIKRSIVLAKTILYLHQSGVEIDGIKIGYETTPHAERKKAPATKNYLVTYNTEKREQDPSQNISKEEIKKYEDILQMINKDSKYFFTSPLVKRYKLDISDPNAPTLRINPSRMLGHIIGRGINYSVYQITPNTQRFSARIESTMSDFLERMYKKTYGENEFRKRNKILPKGTSIFFTDTIKDFEGLVEDSKVSILSGIFSRSFLIPLNEKGKAQTTILLTNNWEEKLYKILFKENEIADAKKLRGLEPDAVMEGTLIYELITMDVNKLQILKSVLALENISVKIVCLEWQEKILQQFFKNAKGSLQIISFSESNEEKLLQEFEKLCDKEGTGQ